VPDLAERLAAVQSRIEAAARRSGRRAADVTLLAVGKTFDAERILEAVDAGLRAFGENRVQEAEAKIPVVNERATPALEWHLVGSLQRNKARRAVELFDVIQSVDRPALATALDRTAAELGRRPRVLVQVNIDEEPQKGGVAPQAAAALVAQVAKLEHLQGVGLMAIPRAGPRPEAQRPAFARLRSLAEELKLEHPELVELSMGMSADYEIAIQEGATIVRIGTALFGQRSTP
jgi:pyridoxal phosphate enzyme (YggS family)